MIAVLKGVVGEFLGDFVVLDCGGVGYGVFLTAADQGTLRLGATAKFYIYENIKEDTHDLFGFVRQDTKKLFEMLLSVKNVGPKVAMAVLGIGTDNVVRQAIAGGDVKYLQTAKGVGKRAAEQIVVELRDKVGAVVGAAAEELVGRSGIDRSDEAMQALVALGYSEFDAQKALQNIDQTLPVEQKIKQALRF